MKNQPGIIEYAEQIAGLAQNLEPVLCGNYEGSELIQEVERLFSEKFNPHNPITVISGTMAFYTGLLALEEDERNEIILPVNICQSLVNAVMLTGYIPVFADIDEDLSINLEDVQAKVTERTAAVLFMHPFGLPVAMDELAQFCKRKDIILFEDCAQATGAIINQRHVGQIGDIVIYSFGQNKPISAGGGGMVCAKDKNLAHQLRLITREGARDYPQFERLGLGLGVNELHALYLYHCISNFDQLIKQKMENVRLYQEVFHGKIPYIGEELAESAGDRPIFHRLVLKPSLKSGRSIDQIFDTLKKSDAKVQKIAQTGLPNPPFKVKYVNDYLSKLGRTDLIDYVGNRYPGWRKSMDTYLYLITHLLVKKEDIATQSKTILRELEAG